MAEPVALAERAFVSCGAYESLICENRGLVPVLKGTGMEVNFVETLDGHDWVCWRGGLCFALPLAIALTTTRFPARGRRSPWHRTRWEPTCAGRSLRGDPEAPRSRGADRWRHGSASTVRRCEHRALRRGGGSYNMVVEENALGTRESGVDQEGRLMDGLYVFNNPWAIQSMEKHTWYCAMMRLGMPIPDTWIVTQGLCVQAGPGDHAEPLRQAVRPRRGRPCGRLSAVRQAVRDGGGWARVSRVDDGVAGPRP